MSPIRITLFMGIALLALSLTASAHSPIFVDDINNLTDAHKVDNPLKSWAFYSVLSSGNTHYYQFEMKEGNRLYISLFSPEADFVPVLYVMGPGFPVSGREPPGVDIPNGYGILIQKASSSTPEYEPFTPGSYYHRYELDRTINVTGTYYVAIYSAISEGSYGLAIGYKEQFTPAEWILIPVNVVRIHVWEGQSFFFIIAPLIATLIAGFIGIFWYQKKSNRRYSLSNLLVILGGLLYAGTGIMMLVQTRLATLHSSPGGAVFVTLLFAALPLLLALFILKQGFRFGTILQMPRHRAIMIVYGILGIVTWSGLIIGPVLVVAAGLFGPRLQGPQHNSFNETPDIPS